MFALPFIHDLVASLESHNKGALFLAALGRCRSAALAAQMSFPDKSDPSVESAVSDLKRNNMALSGKNVLRTLWGWLIDPPRSEKKQTADFLPSKDAALTKEKDTLN